MHAYMHGYMHAYMNACIYACIDTYKHACLHAYMVFCPRCCSLLQCAWPLSSPFSTPECTCCNVPHRVLGNTNTNRVVGTGEYLGTFRGSWKWKQNTTNHLIPLLPSICGLECELWGATRVKLFIRNIVLWLNECKKQLCVFFQALQHSAN